MIRTTFLCSFRGERWPNVGNSMAKDSYRARWGYGKSRIFLLFLLRFVAVKARVFGHHSRIRNDFQHVYGFERNTAKRILTYVSYVLTIGWVRLFFHWYPHFHVYATHNKCPLSRATKLLVTVRIANILPLSLRCSRVAFFVAIEFLCDNFEMIRWLLKFAFPSGKIDDRCNHNRYDYLYVCMYLYRIIIKESTSPTWWKKWKLFPRGI